MYQNLQITVVTIYNKSVYSVYATLFKYGKIDKKLLCSFCIEEDETILHILWSCPQAQDLLSALNKRPMGQLRNKFTGKSINTSERGHAYNITLIRR